MPQLNPTPWLLMMLMTWLIINTMMANIKNMNLTKTPLTAKMNSMKMKTPRIWPW